jgi:hypothetical protein
MATTTTEGTPNVSVKEKSSERSGEAEAGRAGEATAAEEVFEAVAEALPAAVKVLQL